MQGDYFGETALVQKAPRNASVVAVGEVRLRVLSRDQFEEFDLHRKLQLEVSDSAESGFRFLISDLICRNYLSIAWRLKCVVLVYTVTHMPP